MRDQAASESGSHGSPEAQEDTETPFKRRKRQKRERIPDRVKYKGTIFQNSIYKPKNTAINLPGQQPLLPETVKNLKKRFLEIQPKTNTNLDGVAQQYEDDKSDRELHL